MRNEHGALAGSRGVNLFYQRWLPENPPKDVIALVHGVGSHSGAETFRDLISFLTAHDHAVYGMDLRGYGRSGGPAGYIDSWNEYRADIQILLSQIESDFPAHGQFLLGEGLGAVIVLDFIVAVPHRLWGAIAASPALNRPALVPLIHLASALQPRFSFVRKFDRNGLSRDPAKVELYFRDPLMNLTMTLRQLSEYAAAVNRTMSQGAKVATPLLLLHGKGDVIMPYERTEALFGAIPYPNKKLILYPGVQHGIFMDTDSEKVMADLHAWLSRPASSSADRQAQASGS
jgi:alpha-beta hydrolase superfamily lysophospholipase